MLLSSSAFFLVLPRSHAFLPRPAALVGIGACSLFDKLRNLDRISSLAVCSLMAAGAEQSLVSDSSSEASHWPSTVCSCCCRDEISFGKLQYYTAFWISWIRTVHSSLVVCNHCMEASSPRSAVEVRRRLCPAHAQTSTVGRPRKQTETCDAIAIESTAPSHTWPTDAVSELLVQSIRARSAKRPLLRLRRPGRATSAS